VALAADMRGDIMLAQGRLDEARAAYQPRDREGGRAQPGEEHRRRPS
jgi:predicted negative regulator of RcsB-dependent stress response